MHERVGDHDRMRGQLDDDVPTVLDGTRARPNASVDGAAPTLEAVEGPLAGARFPLAADTVIGRAAGADVVVSDPSVSRRHARIVFADGDWVVEDLHSANGVKVNGDRTDRGTLEDGSLLALGATVLRMLHPRPEVDASARLRLLSATGLFDHLDDGDRTALADAALPEYVPAGGVILDIGAPTDRLIMIAAGVAALVEVNDEGSERTIGRIETGGAFGVEAFLTSAPADTRLVAESDVVLLALPRADVSSRVLTDASSSAALLDTVRTRLLSTAAATAPHHRRAPGAPESAVEIIGEDRKIVQARTKLEELAADAGPVLIVGPPGAGKRTFARYLHAHSPRSGDPVVEVSLAGVDPREVGAVLFGVESPRGGVERLGRLEMTGGGTAVIAHTERLDQHQQSRLATLIRHGWFHRDTGTDAVRSQVRIVLTATGTAKEVAATLIPELRDALDGRVVTAPALAHRLKDIPLLAEHFLVRHGAGSAGRPPAVAAEALDRLVSYTWPGNVKELENVVQRAAIVAPDASTIGGDVIFVVPPESEVRRRNVLRSDTIRRTLRNPRLLSTLMLVNAAVVVAVLGFTLYGGSRPPGHPLREFASNPGMLVTWLVWFPLLPISAALLGRIWCGVCPIAGFGDLAARIRRYNLPVPKIFKRLDFWLVAGSFLVVDFLEEILGVADAPLATAAFLLVILYAAAVFSVLYERRAFCRYLCPLAGVLGAYASLSPVEVRGNRKVCQTQCGEHTCFKGTSEVEGCPMGSYPASIANNVECMMCGRCLRSCDNRGVQLNLRPPLEELWSNPRPLLPLSVFGVALVGLMIRHQIPQLGSWAAFEQTSSLSPTALYTALFAGLLAAVLAAFAVAATLSAAASQQTVTANMAAYGIAFIPLAFSGHVAHVAHEVLGEGLYELIGFVGRSVHWLAGPAPFASVQVTVSPFVAGPVVTFVKFLLVAAGAGASAVALVMVARRGGRPNVLARALPHLLLLAVLAVAYVTVFTGSGPAATPAAPAAAASP